MYICIYVYNIPFFLSESPGDRKVIARGGKRGRPRAVSQPSPSSTPIRGALSMVAQLETIPKITDEENSIGAVHTMMKKATKTPAQVSNPSTYTSMGDPKEGTEPKFVPTKLINGVKYAKIDKEGVMPEIKSGRLQFFAQFYGQAPV